MGYGPSSRRSAGPLGDVASKLLFLPAYSPDLNPIEQAFAKLKTLMRKLDAPTVETTWRDIGKLLECGNYLNNSGYGSA